LPEQTGDPGHANLSHALPSLPGKHSQKPVSRLHLPLFEHSINLWTDDMTDDALPEIGRAAAARPRGQLRIEQSGAKLL
jgi:hypothetical protein